MDIPKGASHIWKPKFDIFNLDTYFQKHSFYRNIAGFWRVWDDLLGWKFSNNFEEWFDEELENGNLTPIQ